MNNKHLAINLLRISFGVNFLFHGLVRMPNISGFVSGMQNTFEGSMLPGILVTIMAYVIPFAELIIGFLLLSNKYFKMTIIATFLLMNVLVVGSCIVQKWDVVGLQTTYIGFLFLLLYFSEENPSAIITKNNL